MRWDGMLLKCANDDALENMFEKTSSNKNDNNIYTESSRTLNIRNHPLCTCCHNIATL